MKSIIEPYGRYEQLAEPKPKKKRPGTKPKGPYEDKRAALTTRITQETRTALEGAAQISGRSLSQEIEFRLVQSIRDEDGFGGIENAALFRMLGAAASLIEARTGKSWLEDWDTSLAVQSAWKRIVAQAGGKPSKEILDKVRQPSNLDDLPKMPEFPATTLGQGLFGALNAVPPSEADVEEYEAKRVRYERDMKKYEKDLAASRKKLDESRERFDDAVGLGNEVFDELFPARK